MARVGRYLDDRVEIVQRMAIECLKRSGDPRAVAALARLVIASTQSGGPRVAGVYAATAMKALSGKKGGAALAGYLQHGDPRVREAACHAYAIFFNAGGKAARPLLERCAADGDPALAAAARAALTIIGG